jgi:hypothetical protein
METPLKGGRLGPWKRGGAEPSPPDEEAVEGGEAGDPGTDGCGRRCSLGAADAVDPGEDVGWLHSVGRQASFGEERPEHARVC